MKTIELTQGKVTLVDDEDYDYLSQFKWCALKSGHTFYAARCFNKSTQYMHRLIMSCLDNLEIDHIDHNGLNNQKTNLRQATSTNNKHNKSSCGRSKYLGVTFFTKNNRIYIKAAIGVNHKSKHLGIFKTEEDAARAYDKAAIELHGEFANLNFK